MNKHQNSLSMWSTDPSECNVQLVCYNLLPAAARELCADVCSMPLAGARHTAQQALERSAPAVVPDAGQAGQGQCAAGDDTLRAELS
jgi:hypothetical protein